MTNMLHNIGLMGGIDPAMAIDLSPRTSDTAPRTGWWEQLRTIRLGGAVTHVFDVAIDIEVLIDFPTVDQARSFTSDPTLKAVMEKAGVVSGPQITFGDTVELVQY